MLNHKIKKHRLEFNRPSGTSRGVLKYKDSWFIQLWDDSNPAVVGVGECSIITGLSIDPLDTLDTVIRDIRWEEYGLSEQSQKDISNYPAIQFAVEMALLDLRGGGNRILFPSEFTNARQHIDINGLIWMGDKDFMRNQVRDKIDQGFRCVKLKIGAIDFQTEMDILQSIRDEFSKQDIELRVDANGAFDPEEALEKLERLAQFDLHSIEQPIRQGQADEMRRLCEVTPLPIALDEELIGIKEQEKKTDLIQHIKPHYIILKPSLLGGFVHAQEWINIAELHQVGWWVTSALESNIGLNAIAQWTATLDTNMFQGLGTGQLFTNNIETPLLLKGDRMFFVHSWKSLI